MSREVAAYAAFATFCSFAAYAAFVLVAVYALSEQWRISFAAGDAFRCFLYSGHKKAMIGTL
jgi:hypothetical protein